ncbi:hypothetical protein [Herbiconiux sp. A18JL235]|uniref:Uncharacterized protein n=1 Tax=Herbiconiux sp. A18JL235 TaxID=3152363 RepID=A0AB39BBP2_9MICO
MTARWSSSIAAAARTSDLTTGEAVTLRPILSSDDRAAVTRSLSVAATDPGIAPAAVSLTWPPNP